ncbi:MAG: Fe-S cluster assembly protein SufD [Tepidisphaeraceae bacterium]
MTRLADETNMDPSHFTKLVEQQTPRASRPWLDRLRQDAVRRFHEVGFPTKKQEAWRFTDVSPIGKTRFRPGVYRGTELTRHILSPYSFADEAACELVFVNGHFAPELSSMVGMPDELRVRTIAEALRTDSTRLPEHLGQHAKPEQNAFVALNTGFVHDGAFILLRHGLTVEMPVHLLFVSTPNRDKQPMVSHPRVLIVAEDGTEASVVESYIGIGEGVYFTNAVTEVVAGKDARLQHCKLQQENTQAYHVATMQAHLARGAKFVSHSATIGGCLTRNDLSVLLDGEGAEATLNGLVLIGGKQHADNHTLLDHAAPNCPSHELYKHVLDDTASGVFKGQIYVRPEAQKTDAKQTSQTLLLSDDAQMNSQPALEIYADDVKCTHGSTTGPLNDEAIFYIKSRGVGMDAAQHLLTYAFAADITSRIKVEPVRRRLEEFMAAQHALPQDLRIQKAIPHDEPVRK